MIMKLALTLAASTLAAGIACAQSAADGGPAGKQIYFAHGCYACHGYTGETGARVLIGSALLSSEELFITFLRLRADQNPLTPSIQMPNYSRESLNDADARKLYAYIKTFKSTAPQASNSPAFKAMLDAAARP